jgi:hypothetical protein
VLSFFRSFVSCSICDCGGGGGILPLLRKSNAQARPLPDGFLRGAADDCFERTHTPPMEATTNRTTSHKIVVVLIGRTVVRNRVISPNPDPLSAGLNHQAECRLDRCAIEKDIVE